MASVNNLTSMNMPTSIFTKFAEPDQGQALDYQKAVYLEDLLAEIQHDLVALLNHKRTPLGSKRDYALFSDSLLCYGLPDLSYFNPYSENDRRTVRRLLHETITNFEKRLSNVVISEIEVPDDKIVTTMSFRIHATVNIVPLLAPVTFDSVIYPVKDQVIINKYHLEH